MLHKVPFELREDDVEVSGFAFIGDRSDEPDVHLELIERAPAGIRFEPVTPTSSEGQASYRVANTSSDPFYPDVPLFSTEQRILGEWSDVAVTCFDPTSARAIEPGERWEIRSETLQCFPEPLGEGEFRHVLRLTREPERDFTRNVTRRIELSQEFATQLPRAFSASVFPDVPASKLRVLSWSAGSGSFQATLVAPDGGTACMCPGSIVGRERRRAAMGFYGICLASNLDASVLLCDALEGGSRELGDHPPFPFRREP